MSVPFKSRTGYFAGIFDSDGRTWEIENGGSGLTNYRNALESTLKLAMLTQRHLVLPTGYFLDSPALPLITRKYRGSNQEAFFFRALLKDLLRVAINSKEQYYIIQDWRALTRNWILGTSSNRAQNVYLNSIPHEVARELQGMPVDKFEATMGRRILGITGVDYPQYLEELKQLELASVKRGRFPFNTLIKEQLIAKKDSFSGYNGELEEKVGRIAEVVEKNGIRISRSLLNNPDMCQALGVGEKFLIDRSDYQKLAPILAYYHHCAFTQSIGFDSYVTHGKLPDFKSKLSNLASEKLREHGKDISTFNMPQHLPLSKLKYEDIWNLRLGRHQLKFDDTLSYLENSLGNHDTGEYMDALNCHFSLIARGVSLKFKTINAKEVIPDLDEFVMTGDPSSLNILSLLNHTFLFFRNIVPNINKALQVRWAYRKLASI